MFGPGAKNVKNQNFVLTPTNKEEEALAQKAKQYLEAKGARIVLMTPEEHDEMISIILGLTHFIAIASADTLLSLDKLEETKLISGVTYRMLLMLVDSVISEDPNLCASLQMVLPKAAEVEALFQEKVRTWADLVESKDRRRFVEKMNGLKDRLKEVDPDFEKAHESIYKLIAES